MGVYDQSKYMAIQGECFCFSFRFGTACGTIILQVPLAHIVPETWAGRTGQCLVYLFRYL